MTCVHQRNQQAPGQPEGVRVCRDCWALFRYRAIPVTGAYVSLGRIATAEAEVGGAPMTLPLTFRLRRAVAYAYYRFACFVLPRDYVLLSVLHYECLRKEAEEWRKETIYRHACKTNVSRVLFPRLVDEGRDEP